MFKSNKYTKWYNTIINFRKNNILLEDGEKHHIIPQSLNGTDEVHNIVKLSYREHFICHLLLIKMCECKNHRYKMMWALHRLTFSKSILRSYHYELARKIHIKNLKENHPLKNNEILRKHISHRVKKDWENNDNRRRQAAIHLQKTRDKHREFFNEHNKKASKAGVEAYRQKHQYDIEYKGNYYYSWSNLTRETKITKFLYNEYYTNGIDPELFLGRIGPNSSKKWITDGIKNITWNIKLYPTLPNGYVFGRNTVNRKENQCD